MKKLISAMFIFVSCYIFSVETDYINPYMDTMSAKNGQLYRNDGTVINEADLLSGNFELNVSKGLYPGYIVIDKFGYNPAITTATDPEDIWSYGGVYTFTTTPQTFYVSSSNANDNQNTNFQVLTEDSKGNWNLEIFTQEINGTTKTAIATPSGDPCVRIFRVYNDDSTSYAGNVYIYEDDTVVAGVPQTATKVRAFINNGDNQTLMSIYTVPTGYVGYLFKGEIGMEYTGSVGTGTNFLNANYESRRFGKVFRIKKKITLINNGTSNYEEKRSFPDPIPAKTDIKLQVYEVSETTGAFGTFDILLIPETEFTGEYLDAIGQIQRIE